ncbi:Anaphase-promoting complex subunit 10 [Wickerhamomyces ciferrii]|uniref:Anaphase-promoting complex subunit 10 n=1 Tax=Wickerhamomyces ciferrii (strain ATCC 14091 / BCRC 22168 / CBS 111 / JCM 3599 / NBRC 0793 / NRRL Y-1031 F-60-10) TaxID=1206466 RepID=K0L064_WICCF|nr:Anaphase-promoting complex subunit 10 [Wickerhamomyces ciferrii]CCH46768.1 Anaphase-promoting complex subunit 10 [Wickerhamomyces ciferrii]
MSDSWQDLSYRSQNASENASENALENASDSIEQDSNEEQDDSKQLGGYSMYQQGIRDMETLGLVDVGSLASWTASSEKQDNEVMKLRDESPDTYWQSDGVQPHYIDIHFAKKVSISKISIYIDYALDESYTPSKITVLAGNGFHDLMEVTGIELNEPEGWVHLGFPTEVDQGQILRTFLVRVLIVANHQHGKDTHVRAIKIYSKATTYDVGNTLLGAFTSKRLAMESVIR